MRLGNEGELMSDDQPKKSRTTRVAIALGAVLTFAVAYVLSIGPAYWLIKQGNLSDEALNFYTPVTRLSKVCQPFYAFLQWYVSLFTNG